MVGWMLHASGMKTVNIICYFARVHVTRPSDAFLGKLGKRTATDWVTRGHLRRLFFGAISMVAQCTVEPTQVVSERCYGTKCVYGKYMSPESHGHGFSMWKDLQLIVCWSNNSNF